MNDLFLKFLKDAVSFLMEDPVIFMIVVIPIVLYCGNTAIHIVRKIMSFYSENKREVKYVEDKTVVGVIAAVFFAVILVGSCINFVGAGEVGVIFDPLGGGVQERELTEGMHIILPWKSVKIYNVKTQDYTMSLIAEEGAVARDDRIRCLTSEGLTVDLDMTLLYRINPIKANEIHQTIGVNYVDIVVRPQIRSVIREVISQHTAAEVYGIQRSQVEQEIQTELENRFGEKNIVMERTLLRNVELPKPLADAIESKLSTEQDAHRMVHILDIEWQEAERKRIEAQGIADANDIIAESLTQRYLTWYWIDNLDEHDSVVYVPVGEGGMPMFKEID